jgi:uncharacterized protein (TIGR02466 family)
MAFKSDVSGLGVRVLFPTFSLEKQFDDSANLNRELEALILSARERDPAGMRASNVGGWHGQADFFENSNPACSVLKSRAVELCGRLATLYAPNGGPLNYSIVGWPVINRPGNYQFAHVHSNHHFSGVYYVRSGNPSTELNPLNGALEFIDPRGSGPAMFNNRTLSTQGPRELVHPVDGLMIVFPSWCIHCVHVYEGAASRIAVAFNVCALTPEQAARGGHL